MKQRLADYVADFLAARGVTDVFSVVGGGAMHLNDALGHNPRLHVTYNHHEQACAIAAWKPTPGWKIRSRRSA